MSNIHKLGFDTAWVNTDLEVKLGSYELARVIAVGKDSYVISDGDSELRAELVGKLIYNAESSLDFPTVGDWVLANFYDDNTFAIIHEILPRKSLLKRKSAGKKVDLQLIAANIDIAFIIQSLNDNFNLRRLERYLLMVNEGGISPVVLLSKSDLLAEAEIQDKVNDVLDLMSNIKVIAFTNEKQDSWKNVEQELESGKTYCLLGSSGVGKTTLLNNLLGGTVFKTRTVSKKQSKGRHTTTSRELILLNSGAMIIDTPGMRELGTVASDAGLEQTFSDIEALAENCRFGDCTHTSEAGCAVLAAIETGELSEERWQSYRKISREAAYNEMSYVEKRKKSRQLGKYYKSVMKEKKSEKN